VQKSLRTTGLGKISPEISLHPTPSKTDVVNIFSLAITWSFIGFCSAQVFARVGRNEHVESESGGHWNISAIFRQ